MCVSRNAKLTAVTKERDELVAALKMIATYRDGQCDNGYGARYVAETALAKVGAGEGKEE